ncbi:MAG TPA: hypothetical protein VEC16_05045 [Alphaproteobacteria bacterium]|nr:hypothetical protein [Alphaproteobacteria bacterium]
MDVLEELIKRDPHFSEYRHLRNYVLFRPSCINSKGENIEIKMYKDIIKSYIKTYETLSDIYLNTEYPNYKEIIQSNTEEVIFSSKRLDGIKIELSCKSNHLQLYLWAEPRPYLEYQDNPILGRILGVTHPPPDDSFFAIATIRDKEIDEYEAPRTFFIHKINLTQHGVIISDALVKVPDMINESIDGRLNNTMVPFLNSTIIHKNR